MLSSKLLIIKRSILLCAFVFIALFWIGANNTSAGGPTYISGAIMEPQHWTKEGSPYVVTKSIGMYAPLAIDPGVVIKFYTGAGLSIRSSFSAIGTPEEKIVFTSFRDDNYGGDTNKNGNSTYPTPGYWSSLSFRGGNEKAVLDNSVVHYGSPATIAWGAIAVFPNAKDVTITNTEIKYAGLAGISVFDSDPTVEKCLVSDSKYGIYTREMTIPDSPVAKMSGNSIVNNEFGAYVDRETRNENDMRLDLRNNWWGDKSGPYYKHTNFGYDNLEGKGNPVSDGVIFDPWTGQEYPRKKEPVIFIPGIGASVNLDKMIGGIFNDNWTLFSHTYDGIIEAFKSVGYEEGKNFFIAYYDWRDKNEDSAKNYLDPLIKEANRINGTSKVNIVAHSMGGLVARSYIQSDDYDNDVNNLFLIGTPNKGASDVYPVWEGGRIPNDWDTRSILKIYLSYLTFKLPTSNYYETIHQYIPSVKQMMPVYNYIYPKDNYLGIKNYSEMREVNNWLENLNAGIQKLNDRVSVSVISGYDQKTVDEIPVINVDEGVLWTDGKPDPLNPERKNSRGDGRVLYSSSVIQSRFANVFDYNHGDIVSQSEKTITKRIYAGEGAETIYPAPDIPSEMGFWFASPVDVEIKDPEGRIISGNANEIPLAKYASESKPDGVKMVSIPNPIKGDYEIKITGNGNGEYHIGSEYFDYRGGGKDHSSFAEGRITKGQERKYKVSYDPDGGENPIEDIKIGDETPPEISISSPENKEYLNNQVLDFIYGVSDDLSGVKYEEKFLDGQPFFENGLDLSLAHLKSYVFEVFAEDNAGNSARKSIEFSVIATIDSIAENLKKYQEMNLIDPGEVKFISTKLGVIKHLAERENNKENILENYQEQADRQIDWLTDYINEKSEKNNKEEIKEPAKSFLIESLEFIKFK